MKSIDKSMMTKSIINSLPKIAILLVIAVFSTITSTITSTGSNGLRNLRYYLIISIWINVDKYHDHGDLVVDHDDLVVDHDNVVVDHDDDVVVDDVAHRNYC